MFKDTEAGETQSCPMCQEWAEKYTELDKRNTELYDRFCRLAETYDETRSIAKITALEALDYKTALKDVKKIAEKHDYWSGSLQSATEVINEIIDKISEVLND